MKIDWTTRGVKVPDPLRSRVERHVRKLERMLRGETRTHLVVTRTGDDVTQRQRFEAVLTNPLGTFTGTEESRDLAEAATQVLKKLDVQVRRAHDKKREGRRHPEPRTANAQAEADGLE